MGWIGFLAGLIITLVGIHLMMNGFGMYDDLLVKGVAFILLAIGLVTIITFAIGAISGEHEEREDEEEQEDEHDYFKNQS
jgi:TctA family transporter